MERILVCGLNGAGKSTVGRMLAERRKDVFIDIEDLYFPKTDSSYLYSSPRSEEEVSKILLDRVRSEENLVLSSVTGKYIKDFDGYFQACVVLEVPRHVRIERVQKRSYDKFGDRAFAGGDLFDKEQAFLNLVKSRKETLVEEWLQTVHVPIIRMDGQKPPDVIVERIIETLFR